MDAGAENAAGRLHRCLALARAWRRRGGDPVFVTSMEAPELEKRLRQRATGVLETIQAVRGSHEDARFTAALASERGVNAVVLDGDRFDTDYERIVAATDATVLRLDDAGGGDEQHVDAVLDPNPSAQVSAHGGEPELVLLGPRYAPVVERRPWGTGRSGPRGDGLRILVMLGKTGEDAIVATILEGVSALVGDAEPTPEPTVRVLAGREHAVSAHAASRLQVPNVEVELVTDPEDATSLARWADVAVSDAGPTVWELIHSGTPTVTVTTHESQSTLARSLEEHEVTVHAGDGVELNAAGLAEALGTLQSDATLCSEAGPWGREFVDGHGADRVAMHLARARTYLRPARPRDAGLLWRWANDRDVREASFSPKSISWPEHIGWYRDKLRDPSTYIWILQDADDTPVGQIRFDEHDPEVTNGDLPGIEGSRAAEIDVSVAQRFRGEGHGIDLIDLGVRRLFATSDYDLAVAEVKEWNTPSRRGFESAGFTEVGTRTVNKTRVHVYWREST